ncbi:hypothetical protein MPTK1_1g16740 [Marchantia polymorpha subsp. ruderalis]|uniref:Uncharacterized protein n=2 Tax=Marchantia polymorpha TaxID=3197 RepID=A0AAF6AQY5_MARPO|nr:hypothetical protein MARPO_0001s0015 [Marchantia polymorpha]BBM98855.1 hypothetical protein Mp_1g16740 [Marchantia polymorpha subsp. ruderalis]|eukprot:PTQ49931.1 hypothetical protein MARPO_0001s0015 [Marchantia polymorpha]
MCSWLPPPSRYGEMAGRLGPPHYNLNSGNPLVGNTLHDLNTVDSRNGDLEGITDTDRDPATGDSLDHEEDSNSGGCVPQSYGNSIALQSVSGPETDHSMPLEGDEPPRSPYGVLTLNDVIPIETARARFLQIIIDHFITHHIVPTPESPTETNYNSPNSKEKLKKRIRTRDGQYEGDPRYLLPLTFVANLYETLIHEVNQRLGTVEGSHEKTMGVALEAAGGLYRRLVKRYPKSGGPMTFKRREMASALEARTKFPQLVTGDEKRVRFVVVHGLELVERPTLPPEDSEWFKRLTGRHEAAITPRDYNFFSPRVKHRRTPQHSLSVGSLPAFPEPSTSLPPPLPIRQQVIPQFSSGDSGSMGARSPPLQAQQQQQQQAPLPHQQTHQSHQHPHQVHCPVHILGQSHTSQSQNTPTHGAHTTHASLTPHTAHSQHNPHTPPHVQSPVMHTGGVPVMLSMPPNTPAKYCDECGAQYLRETSKYCSECGAKRLGT